MDQNCTTQLPPLDIKVHHFACPLHNMFACITVSEIPFWSLARCAVILAGYSSAFTWLIYGYLHALVSLTSDVILQTTRVC